ncbi:PREDICTED: UPF0472 protein C16orf72 homolog [Charadrius vociferus]|uniref:UPF0472 protein C16orf72 homolog n=1 Tax=Charadrius vociferus TaxID=50402 RepID=UPI0005219980|nr:PREDICTED: UPF0472 protein C16orf72 homolog [Charadrius vociferus]
MALFNLPALLLMIALPSRGSGEDIIAAVMTADGDLGTKSHPAFIGDDNETKSAFQPVGLLKEESFADKSGLDTREAAGVTKFPLESGPGRLEAFSLDVITKLVGQSVDAHQRSFDVGIQIGYQRRNKDVLAWVKKRRRTIRREDLISFLCGKVPPPRNSRAPPRLTVVSPSRATSTETNSSVETDLQPFREAIALHGLSGAMASISVRSSTPGSPTHVSSGSNASRRRNGLHDVDLNTFISEEMALHLDNGGTRKRTSAQCGDVITDSPTHKRNRMI